jgi:hypothetical protein
MKDEVARPVLFGEHRLQGCLRVAIEPNMTLLIVLNVEVQVGLISYAQDPPLPVNVGEFECQHFRHTKARIAV